MKYKKILFISILVLMIFLVVFSLWYYKLNPTKTIDQENSDTPLVKIQPPLISQYNQLIASSPDELELIDFIDSHYEEMTSEEVSKIYAKLITYYQDNLASKNIKIDNDYIQRRLLKTYDEAEVITNLDKIDDSLIYRKAKKYYSQGYQLALDNGRYQLVINYGFFKRKYGEQFNEEISDYHSILDKLYAFDETIMVQWENVYYNVLMTERFLSNYENSILYHEVYEYYIESVEMLLFGNDYEYIFKGNQLKEDVLNLYKRITIEQNETFFKETFDNYYNILIDQEFKKTPIVIEKRIKAIDLIKDKYEPLKLD